MNEESSSDADLVERARRGDTAAFARLVTRYEDYIYNVVGHMVGFGPDASDLTQEVFLKAFRGLEGFEGRSKFKTWLYGIMLNCVRTHRRRRGRGPEVWSLEAGGSEDNPAPHPPARQRGSLARTIAGERVELVRRTIRSLPQEMREILVLRDLQGLSYRELGQSLELPMGTVKSRLARARRRLKEELQPHLSAEF